MSFSECLMSSVSDNFALRKNLARIADKWNDCFVHCRNRCCITAYSQFLIFVITMYHVVAKYSCSFHLKSCYDVTLTADTRIGFTLFVCRKRTNFGRRSLLRSMYSWSMTLKQFAVRQPESIQTFPQDVFIRDRNALWTFFKLHAWLIMKISMMMMMI